MALPADVCVSIKLNVNAECSGVEGLNVRQHVILPTMDGGALTYQMSIPSFDVYPALPILAPTPLSPNTAVTTVAERPKPETEVAASVASNQRKSSSRELSSRHRHKHHSHGRDTGSVASGSSTARRKHLECGQSSSTSPSVSNTKDEKAKVDVAVQSISGLSSVPEEQTFVPGKSTSSMTATRRQDENTKTSAKNLPPEFAINTFSNENDEEANDGYLVPNVVAASVSQAAEERSRSLHRTTVADTVKRLCTNSFISSSTQDPLQDALFTAVAGKTQTERDSAHSGPARPGSIRDDLVNGLLDWAATEYAAYAEVNKPSVSLPPAPTYERVAEDRAVQTMETSSFSRPLSSILKPFPMKTKKIGGFVQETLIDDVPGMSDASSSICGEVQQQPVLYETVIEDDQEDEFQTVTVPSEGTNRRTETSPYGPSLKSRYEEEDAATSSGYVPYETIIEGDHIIIENYSHSPVMGRRKDFVMETTIDDPAMEDTEDGADSESSPSFSGPYANVDHEDRFEERLHDRIVTANNVFRNAPAAKLTQRYVSPIPEEQSAASYSECSSCQRGSHSMSFSPAKANKKPASDTGEEDDLLALCQRANELLAEPSRNGKSLSDASHSTDVNGKVLSMVNEHFDQGQQRDNDGQQQRYEVSHDRSGSASRSRVAEPLEVTDFPLPNQNFARSNYSHVSCRLSYDSSQDSYGQTTVHQRSEYQQKNVTMVSDPASSKEMATRVSGYAVQQESSSTMQVPNHFPSNNEFSSLSPKSVNNHPIALSSARIFQLYTTHGHFPKIRSDVSHDSSTLPSRTDSPFSHSDYSNTSAEKRESRPTVKANDGQQVLLSKVNSIPNVSSSINSERSSLSKLLNAARNAMSDPHEESVNDFTENGIEPYGFEDEFDQTSSTSTSNNNALISETSSRNDVVLDNMENLPPPIGEHEYIQNIDSSETSNEPVNPTSYHECPSVRSTLSLKSASICQETNDGPIRQANLVHQPSLVFENLLYGQCEKGAIVRLTSPSSLGSESSGQSKPKKPPVQSDL